MRLFSPLAWGEKLLVVTQEMHLSSWNNHRLIENYNIGEKNNEAIIDSKNQKLCKGGSNYETLSDPAILQIIMQFIGNNVNTD